MLTNLKFLGVILACALFASCKKNDQKANTSNSVINDARDYFETEIKPTVAKPEKTALWEQAKWTKEQNNSIVVVPLKFDKKLTLKSNLFPNTSLPADLQTKLILIRDNSGKFKTKVYTYLPSSEYLENKQGGFSGILNIADWDGKTTENLFFKNGRYTHMPAENQNQKTTTITCYTANLYTCLIDDAGNYYDCQLVRTEFLGCFSDNNEQISWIDNDDGTGYGYASENDLCESPQSAFRGSQTSEVGDGIVTSETADTRTKYYPWTIYRQNYGLWHIDAPEKGYHKKVNAQWKWDKIENIDVHLVGSYTGGSIEPHFISQQSYSGTTATFMGVDLIWNCSISVVCKGFPIGHTTDDMTAKGVFALGSD